MLHDVCLKPGVNMPVQMHPAEVVIPEVRNRVMAENHMMRSVGDLAVVGDIFKAVPQRLDCLPAVMVADNQGLAPV